MRLLDLEPKWLMRGPARLGFTFICPTDPKWRQSCFAIAPTFDEQMELFGDDDVQPCRTDCGWVIKDAGGRTVLDAVAPDFATISVTPSIDGSAGGLWHGFITNGQIVGGV